MTLLIVLCFFVSAIASVMLVPSVRSLALQWGFVDRPDSDRKLHRKPIALCGGVAVFAAIVVSFLAIIQIDRRLEWFELGVVETRWYVLFFAVAAILLVGLIDDAWSLRGRQKLLLQFLIITALVGSGTIIEIVSVFGKEVHLGPIAFPVTVLWLLIAVNALNLIDGADGMATTVGCFVSAGLTVLAWQTGSPMGAVLAVSLSGALIGFLFFNRPPATIFLGDAGSMMIGLFVGVLAVWSSVKESTVLASAPVAILALPLFDSSAAILRRWLTGRSIYATDRAHLHHLLQERFGPRGMLVVVAAFVCRDDNAGCCVHVLRDAVACRCRRLRRPRHFDHDAIIRSRGSPFADGQDVGIRQFLPCFFAGGSDGETASPLVVAGKRSLGNDLGALG